MNDVVLPAISLFSGAGGMDIGLEQAGFESRVCVEWIDKRVATLNRNRPQWPTICGDIREVSTREILKAAGLKKGEAALVAGGPPCQAFSKSAYWVPGRIESILDDPRALLLREYVRVVKEAAPKAFIMENVFGLAYSHGRPALDAAIATLSKEGYKISYKVVNAADYGVPQRRERLICIGIKGATEPFRFPRPTHVEPKPGNSRLVDALPYVTAGDVLADLDDGRPPGKGEEVAGKYGHLLPEVPPGDNYLYYTAHRGHPKPLFKWRSKYWSFLLKLSPDLPSWTIQASPGPYIGPFHWRNRRLRISEVKRLQTFPDDWELAGARGEQWSQLGDAVPCHLAKVFGEAIREQAFEGEKPKKAKRLVAPRATRQATLS